MRFQSFRMFVENISEESELIQDQVDYIFDVLEQLDDEDLDELGLYLYYEYFFQDDQNEDDIPEYFDIQDIKDMINVLSTQECADLMLDDIIGQLEFDEFDSDEINEVLEAVTPYLKAKNRNLKKRKFMKNSKMYMLRTAQKRKRENLLTKNKRRRNYLVNKNRIKLYQKSRASAIKKHTHIVKKRKRTGSEN